jgi:hypothetical protein
MKPLRHVVGIAIPLLALTGAAALFTSAGATASAQTAAGSAPHHAAAARSADAGFSCPSATVCLFPNDDYTGNYAGGSPVELPTDVYNGSWYSFSQVGASDPNPGSINDNSNSVMWLYVKSAGIEVCLPPGKSIETNSFGYIYIQYGVTSCGAFPSGPLP